MALSANAACTAFRSFERRDVNKVARSIPATRSFPRIKGPRVKCTAEPGKEPSLDAPKPTNPPPFRPKVSTNFSDVFAFSGPAPETINGRLAMVGFVSAVGVELVTGEDLLTQLSQGEGITWFLFTASVLTAASLIPMFQGVTRESRSRALMSSTAETWNGRLAQRQLNLRNSCYLLHQWNMYRTPICRAGHFGGEYSGNGAYNRKKTFRNSNGIGGQQEHYTVLGLAKGATSADIKKAFRTLARQYHPDVNKDPNADDSFKSIRLAYEVLSNETTRYQYDKALRLQESGINGQWRESELNGGRRYSWVGMKRQARGLSWEDYFEAYEPSFYSYEYEEFVEEKMEEKAPVQDLLRYVWFTIFCCQILGSQIALNLFSFCAILNRQLTASYKVAHMIAWLIGGHRGILLILALSFTSWFSGKQYDNLIALTALALWIEVGIARYFPIPRGAIMAMTYFSYKLQLELS